MSIALANTHNVMGVRTLGHARPRYMKQTRPTMAGYMVLGRLGSAPDQDTINALIAAGYDPSNIQLLVLKGATDEQLLALPYPAASDEMAAAVQQLMGQLSGIVPAPGQSVGTASHTQTAQQISTWQVNTAFGVYDLMQDSAWQAINSQFIQTQQQLNTLSAQSPNDPQLTALAQQFNSLVLQWAGYYQQVFGSSPSPLPLASQHTLGKLGALGIAPLVVAGVAAGVVALLYALYTINNGIAAWRASTAVRQTQASTQSSLTQQIAAASAAGNTALVQQLTQAMQESNPNTGSFNLTTFLQQYGIWIAVIAGGAIVLPPLIKKL